jgi:hypothetical protein
LFGNDEYDKKRSGRIIHNQMLEEKTVVINRGWHEKHPMPKKPTQEQRIKWHLAHQKNCGCRPIPPPTLNHQINKKKNLRQKGPSA